MTKIIGCLVILLVVAGLITGVLDIGAIWNFLCSTTSEIVKIAGQWIRDAKVI